MSLPKWPDIEPVYLPVYIAKIIWALILVTRLRQHKLTLFSTRNEYLVIRLKSIEMAAAHTNIYRHVSTCIQLYTYLVTPPES